MGLQETFEPVLSCRPEVVYNDRDDSNPWAHLSAGVVEERATVRPVVAGNIRTSRWKSPVLFTAVGEARFDSELRLALVR
jgi:hypothetical protein